MRPFSGDSRPPLCAKSAKLSVIHGRSAAEAYHALANPLAPFAQPDCEVDCHIPWGQYRHGALWENYCFERWSCYSNPIRDTRACGDDSCSLPPRRVSCATFNLRAPRSAAFETAARKNDLSGFVLRASGLEPLFGLRRSMRSWRGLLRFHRFRPVL